MKSFWPKIALGLAIMGVIYLTSWIHCRFNLPILTRSNLKNLSCANLEFPTYFIPFFMALAIVAIWPSIKKNKD